MAESPTSQVPALDLRRTYPVSAEKVWRAWTDPQALIKWFGPGDTDKVRKAEIDLRVGGRYWIEFNTLDGEEHGVGGIYREVVENEKLVFSWAWKSTPERESLVTIVLRPDGHRTELQFRHEQFFDEAAMQGHSRGWTGALTRLDSFVQGKPVPSSPGDADLRKLAAAGK
jgi:uncharacterized protein YndB with AHSA1/START domain